MKNHSLIIFFIIGAYALQAQNVSPKDFNSFMGRQIKSRKLLLDDLKIIKDSTSVADFTSLNNSAPMVEKSFAILSESSERFSLRQNGILEKTKVEKARKNISSAQSFEVDGINYNITSTTDKTVEVTSNNLEYTGDVIIPASVKYNGEDYAVIAIGNEAFSFCENIISIVIPNSVLKINAYAFYFCSGLPTIIIPNSVTAIGRSAFAGCSSLRYVVIPSSVMTIGEAAFRSCTSLIIISVDKSSTTYSSIDGVLYNKNKSTLIQYPGGKTGAFTILNSVINIENSAFSGCSSLTSVVIPNSVTTIGNVAFSGCSSLVSVTISSSVAVIGSYAFDYCNDLTAIEVDVNNAAYSSIDGVLFNKGQTTLIRCPSKKTGNFVVPDGVTTIGDGAFVYCESLNLLTISNSVTTIGNYAFESCSGLTSITIPNSVIYIGGYAFWNCSGLIEIISLNTTPPALGNDVFSSVNTTSCVLIVPVGSKTAYQTAEQWKNFTNIREEGENPSGTCGDKLTWVLTGSTLTIKGEGAMTNYDSSSNRAPWYSFRSNIITTIIGDSVTSIGNSAFVNCNNLTAVNIPNSVTTIGNFAFSSCYSLISVIIPYNVVTIGSYAFDYCLSLTAIDVDFSNTAFSSIDGVLYNKEQTTLIRCPSKKTGTFVVPDGVTTIGNGAFVYCDGLISLSIPNSVISIGHYAFEGCSGLVTITIPQSVTTIGIAAFVSCESLMEVVVNDANTAYSSIDGVLYNKEISTLVSYPAGKSGAFTIPNGVINVSNYAFAACGGLTSVVIPNSVTDIGNTAFYYCSGLTEIVSKNPTPPVLGSNVFYGVTITNCVLIVPVGSKAAYQIAEQWKDFTNIREEGESPGGTCGDNLTWVLTGSTLTIKGEGAMTNYDSSSNRAPWYSFGSNIITTIIGDSVTSIGNSAFANCNNLTAVNIPNSVINIGYYAFEGCSGLVNITIPNSVTTIEEYAFAKCTSLKEVIVEWENPLIINNTIFEGVTISAVTLKVPKGTQIDYMTTSVWKEFIVIEYSPTSLKSIANAQFTIYPNPASESIHVKGISGYANISFIDISGKQILNKDITSETVIHIENLSKGWYLVDILTENGTEKIKLVKN